MTRQDVVTTDLTLYGPSRRIMGDFTNAAVANRALFQSSVANGASEVGVMPNGTAQASWLELHNRSNLDGGSTFYIGIDNTAAQISPGPLGATGTFLPLALYTSATERLRIRTDGVISLGNDPNPPTIRTPAGSALSVEARSNYLFMVAGLNSHMTSNSYWDGASWLAINPASPSAYLGVQNTGFGFGTSPATAGALPLTMRFQVDTSAGPLTATFSSDTASGQLTIGPSYGILKTANGALYLRPSTTSPIYFDTGGQLRVNGSINTPADYADIYYMGQDQTGYYVNRSGTNFQVVAMNVLSWGWLGFNGNPGINWSWDGTYIHSTHSVYVNGSVYMVGSYLYFANNGGVYWLYTGNMYSPQSIESGGYLRANNGYVYFRNDNAICWYWDGSWMRHSGGSGIGTAGSYVWVANNSNIGLYWDGTWLFCQPQVRTQKLLIWQTGSSVAWTDDNVRIYRQANQMWLTCYDAWFQFTRTWDGAGCGYVDIGGFHNQSTLRGKTNVKPLRDGLSVVRDERVTPITYDIPGDSDHPATPSLGFAAEHMVEVVPEVVGLDEKGLPYGINYGALVPVLWDAVRTLNGQIETLTERITQLEGQAA